MKKITSIILTFNEASNIKQAIESIQSLSEVIYVVDSFSTDDTVEIAQSLGAKVLKHSFTNQAAQFDYALKTIDIKTKWVLRLDADERLSNKAVLEIETLLETAHPDLNGIVVPFEVSFLGKKLRHGGIYPFKKMILFKKEKAYMEQRHMDEHIVLKEGKTKSLRNISYHEDYKDITAWIDKHNKYASREVLDFFEQKSKSLSGLSFPAKVKRILKYNVYYKIPMGLRAFSYFIYRYIVRLGFLDGHSGFIFTVLQAFWYRFLVDVKIYEAKKNNRN